MKRRLFALLTLFAVMAFVPVKVLALDEISHEDRIAIKDVVQLQLDALAEDDADTAFALTTAGTRTKLGDPETFMEIIKEQFRPIYRHQRAIFSSPEIVAGRAVQRVRLTDSSGLVWLAVFMMQREADDNWRVDDCKLFATSTISV